MIEVVVLAEDIKSCLVAIERHENHSVIIINFTWSNQCVSSVLQCVCVISSCLLAFCLDQKQYHYLYFLNNSSSIALAHGSYIFLADYVSLTDTCKLL